MSIIVCTDTKFGISKDGKIPWNIPEDLKFFRKITLKSTVIMGRKTYESIGSKPLPGRTNLVVSSSGKFKSLLEALEASDKPVFIIGGSSIYNEAMKNNLCEKIYLNVVSDDFNCDNFIENPIKYGFKIDSSEFVEVNDGLILEKRIYLKN